MKCPYCGREVVPNGKNCPRCYAKIVLDKPVADENENNEEDK